MFHDLAYVGYLIVVWVADYRNNERLSAQILELGKLRPVLDCRNCRRLYVVNQPNF